jgi:hypothetical protein
MLGRVVSGGQTGPDQGAWRAAKACGIPAGGFMPRGSMTEEGPRPEFAGPYGGRPMDSSLGPEPRRTPQ